MKIVHLSAIIILMISILVIIPSESSGEPTEDPAILVVMEDYTKNVNVAPGRDGVVTFNGSVSINITEDSWDNGYIIQLFPDCDGWPLSSPPAISLDRNHTSADFHVTVQAPIGASSSGSKVLNIVVQWLLFNGTARGEMDPVECEIIVDPYVVIDVQGITFQESEKGDWTDYTVFLVNEGNSDANLTLIPNEVHHILEIEPMEVNVFVPERGEVEQVFRIRQKKGIAGDNGYVTISVTTEDGEITNEFSLYYRSERDYTIHIFIAISAGLLILIIILFAVASKMSKKQQKKLEEE